MTVKYSCVVHSTRWFELALSRPKGSVLRLARVSKDHERARTLVDVGRNERGKERERKRESKHGGEKINPHPGRKAHTG